jgi:hypothetical protein
MMNLVKRIYLTMLHLSQRCTHWLQQTDRYSFKLLVTFSERQCLSERSLAQVATQQQQTLHHCWRRLGRKIQQSPVFILEFTFEAHCLTMHKKHKTNPSPGLRPFWLHHTSTMTVYKKHNQLRTHSSPVGKGFSNWD